VNTRPLDDKARGRLRVLVIAHHSEIVSRLTFWNGGDRGLAEECAQEVWAKVAADLKRYVGDPHPLNPLVQVAWNIHRNHFRKKKRRGEQRPGAETITALSDNSVAERLLRGVRRLGPDRRGRDTRAVPDAGPDSYPDPIGVADLNIDLAAAIAKLSPRQQEALFLHYRHDLAPAGIAIRMGITRQAAEKLLKNTFRTLKISPRLAGWAEEEVGR
jgi:RNA polymerase sigma factor (sigma-70 family)